MMLGIESSKSEWSALHCPLKFLDPQGDPARCTDKLPLAKNEKECSMGLKYVLFHVYDMILCWIPCPTLYRKCILPKPPGYDPESAGYDTESAPGTSSSIRRYRES